MKLKQCFNYFRLALSVYVDKQASGFAMGLDWRDRRQRETDRETQRQRQRVWARQRQRVWVKIVSNIYFYVPTDYHSARTHMTKLLQGVQSSHKL